MILPEGHGDSGLEENSPDEWARAQRSFNPLSPGPCRYREGQTGTQRHPHGGHTLTVSQRGRERPRVVGTHLEKKWKETERDTHSD